ncbi:hypothetical protein QTJ16_004742 [Diplocarpon rosae]|uniref:Uncharacterized protein n=1 Tax=Diplocarpon rosae TaxID=946125 RepID=A0AAD9SZA8_9HELO|nr:hypothetical protein QTJ16_004742 [Diplocarpon rosae]PBP18815.1 hypothetical protein BUE80_DR010515 [Diplocarpon rosae]
MSLRCLLRYALLAIVPLCLVFSVYLYSYPAFHFCAFPSPEQNSRTEYINTLRHHIPWVSRDAIKVAPFRLLALGDPQLEGDSSIPDAEAASFPHLSKFWGDALRPHGPRRSALERLRLGLHDLIDFYLDDIPKALRVYHKRLDHVGNDYYLGHIYRTMHWWADPTHVAVLGDLVGSQWIDDDEFESRGWRYWNRVFRGGAKVSEELAWREEDQGTLMLGEDTLEWKRRIINVAGNHDVGYAGDLTPERMARFTKVFGNPNYELRFRLPVNSTIDIGRENTEERPIPELRIVVLNDMNLDTPVGSQEMQDETYDFLNRVISSSEDVTRSAHFTVVLTHIPMYKNAGICVDGPFFDFFDGTFGNGVKEQNHLSRDATKGFLEGIFGMSKNSEAPGAGLGRNGIILTGHDHEGCNVYHYINQSSESERQWEAITWMRAIDTHLHEQRDLPGLREVTVRSMMGDYAGNAGLMSIWFDEEIWDWKFEFANCGLGIQHIWWLIHILDLIAAGIALIYGALLLWDQMVLRIAGEARSLDIREVYSAKESGNFQDKNTSGGSAPTNGAAYSSAVEKTSLGFGPSKMSLDS